VNKRLLIAALIAIPLLRIIATYAVFSQTSDEPFHIAAGLQWLTTGQYDLDIEHPPLARIAFGIDAALHGAKLGSGDPVEIGNALLERDGGYIRNLAAARAGNLPFFLLTLAVVGWWTRRLFGHAAALIALALFGALPPILGHAGLATTDMAAAATTVTALYFFARWLEVPSWPNALLLSVACGLGLLSKFSFVIFFPVAAIVMAIVHLVFHRDRVSLVRIAQIAAGALLAFVMVWAAYKFSTGTFDVGMRPAWQRIANQYRIPAPQFLAGLHRVHRHSAAGHWGYLFGESSRHGWWYYFPVVIFFKTPLAFLAAAAIGSVRMLRSRSAEAIGVAITPLAMLVPAMTSGINIGVRHVLPIFPLLAICAAYGVLALWRRSRVAVIVLLAWYFVATALAHPDYMSYFNEAAAGHPERIAADSNLDWGQDLLRLGDVVRREHIDHLYVAYFGSAEWQRFVPQGQQLPPLTPVHGWVAISENERLFLLQAADQAPYAWLRAYQPVRRIGTSIWLYWIPPG
jgi:hypothetical protein